MTLLRDVIAGAGCPRLVAVDHVVGSGAALLKAAANIDPHMRGCGTFLDVHNRALNLIGSAKPHECFPLSVGTIRMPEYRLKIYPQEKRYAPAGEEIPHYTEIFHAPNDAAATDEACSRYDMFAVELAKQVKPKIAHPRLDRGELYEGHRAVCDIWQPARRF